MEQIETVVRTACADHLVSGRIRAVETRLGHHGIPVCTVTTDRLTLTSWIYHGELDGNLRPAWQDVESLYLRWALSHLGAAWAGTWDRDGIMAAFAEHLGTLEQAAADPRRWESFCAAASPRA